uniref:Uncharacterized protein n=1 Tax=Magallana gigas TaxID=29159 RepID=K1PXD8_MAGGI
MSGKQSKDLMVPAWFLSAIDLITTAQKTTKITGICIQIIKDIVETSGFSVAVVTPSVGELLDEQISSVAII